MHRVGFVKQSKSDIDPAPFADCEGFIQLILYETKQTYGRAAPPLEGMSSETN